MSNKRVHNIEISNEAANSFIDWSTKLAQQLSNRDFESKNVRRLVIDLSNQIRSDSISLEAAENMFLMKTDMISLKHREGFEL